MSEYREKRTVIHDFPAVSRPVLETRHDSVVNERRGMSGVAVAVLVVAAITAVVITMLIVNSQQKNHDKLVQETARAAAAQETPGQQQPVIVNIPQSQPAIVPAPYPVAGPGQPPPIYARTGPSSASVEIEVTSRLQNDKELRPYAVFVKVTGGSTILSGYVRDENLRTRAEKLASTVKGVQNIINDIAVRP